MSHDVCSCAGRQRAPPQCQARAFLEICQSRCQPVVREHVFRWVANTNESNLVGAAGRSPEAGDQKDPPASVSTCILLVIGGSLAQRGEFAEVV